MNALSLKRDILKPDWVHNFSVMVHVDNQTWFHCHDDEEIKAGNEISLRARLPLPIPTSLPYYDESVWTLATG